MMIKILLIKDINLILMIIYQKKMQNLNFKVHQIHLKIKVFNLI